jgi:hypothetical protein
MQKAALGKLLPCRAFLVSAVAFGGTLLPTIAHDAAPPAAAPVEMTPNNAMQNDPTAFMLKASQSYGLPLKGDQTWHLKVTFNIFDEQGKSADQGVFEEFYVNPSKFKETDSVAGFSQVTYGSDKGRMRAGIPRLPYPLMAQLPGLFVNPLPLPMQISQGDLATEQRVINGASCLCISIKSRPRTPDEQAHLVATYCFDAKTNSLRTSILNPQFQGPLTIIQNRLVSFQSRFLPGDLEIDREGKVALTAHLVTIEPVGASDDAVFVPSPDATPLEIKILAEKPDFQDGKATIPAGFSQGMVLTRVAPIYPPIARAARVQGTVVLQAVIDKDGHVSDLQVISGPPLLLQVAMDAVKQ